MLKYARQPSALIIGLIIFNFTYFTSEFVMGKLL